MIGNLLAAHAFVYIVFRVKSGLTSGEDIATPLVSIKYKNQNHYTNVELTTKV